MGIATLANVPRTPEEWSVFTFSNQDDHRQVATDIFRKFGATLSVYAVDPLDPNDLSWWTRNEQDMHDSVNAIIGRSGPDITQLNPQDPVQTAAWIFLHFSDHIAWDSYFGAT